jgi:hypothetical protein
VLSLWTAGFSPVTGVDQSDHVLQDQEIKVVVIELSWSKVLVREAVAVNFENAISNALNLLGQQTFQVLTFPLPKKLRESKIQAVKIFEEVIR